MKKILHIIICMLTLSASTAWAGTTVSTQTIWSEDFDNVQGTLVLYQVFLLLAREEDILQSVL